MSDGQLLKAVLGIMEDSPHPSILFGDPVSLLKSHLLPLTMKNSIANPLLQAISLKHVERNLSLPPSSIDPAMVMDMIEPLCDSLFDIPRKPINRELKRGTGKEDWLVFVETDPTETFPPTPGKMKNVARKLQEREKARSHTSGPSGKQSSMPVPPVSQLPNDLIIDTASPRALAERSIHSPLPEPEPIVLTLDPLLPGRKTGGLDRYGPQSAGQAKPKEKGGWFKPLKPGRSKKPTERDLTPAEAVNRTTSPDYTIEEVSKSFAPDGDIDASGFMMIDRGQAGTNTSSNDPMRTRSHTGEGLERAIEGQGRNLPLVEVPVDWETRTSGVTNGERETNDPEDNMEGKEIPISLSPSPTLSSDEEDLPSRSEFQLDISDYESRSEDDDANNKPISKKGETDKEDGFTPPQTPFLTKAFEDLPFGPGIPVVSPLLVLFIIRSCPTSFTSPSGSPIYGRSSLPSSWSHSHWLMSSKRWVGKL